MHTHHSHSGQFCQHAKNTLEEVIQRAIELNFNLICLTEHMPRLHPQHLYPEEINSNTTIEGLFKTFDDYFRTARHLQVKYKDQIDVLVGFETESIDHEYMKQVELLIDKYKPDMFVGSLHHSNGIPIDFDKSMFLEALSQSQNSMDQLCTDYFIQLFGMVLRLKPPVIGHFDLITLFDREFDLKKSRAWPHILRTVKMGIKNGSLFEVNSSGFRKGLPETYPQHDILVEIIKLGGKICLSDDSHGVEQVATNYERVLEYLDRVGVKVVYRLGLGGVEEVEVERFREWLERTK